MTKLDTTLAVLKMSPKIILETEIITVVDFAA